jgi:hypothetical protein
MQFEMFTNGSLFGSRHNAAFDTKAADLLVFGQDAATLGDAQAVKIRGRINRYAGSLAATTR